MRGSDAILPLVHLSGDDPLGDALEADQEKSFGDSPFRGKSR
jgi:hypothetical protein